MTSLKWLRRSMGFFTLLFLFLNLYVFFTREWESSFFPASYATLYYPLDIPTIRRWELVDRNHVRLDLACTQDIAEWKVLTDGKNEQTASGLKPSFRIDTTFAQLHTYTLIPVSKQVVQPVKISIQFYGEEFYASQGMKHMDVYIVRANVPCGEFEQFSVNDWVDDYHYVGEMGLAEADRILHDVIGIRDTDPTFTRMEKVVRYLRIKLRNSGGVPKDDERWMNPWLLHNELVNGTGKGWCTQTAQDWVFWANRAGIPTRFVFGARTQDNTIVYTGHSWAESFIREQNRWAFTDVTQGHIYITDREGQVLNTAELMQLNQHNAFDSTFVRAYVDWLWKGHAGFKGEDTVETVPYALCNRFFRSEFTSHQIIKYRRPPNVEDIRDIYSGLFHDRTYLLGNIERYLFKPPLAYSFYPTEGSHTYLVRRILFSAFIACLLLWLTFTVIGKRTKQKR